MKHIKIPRRSFLGLWAGLLSFSFSSIALAGGPAPERDQRRFEVGFLASMIDHHFGGVALAELAETRATHDELQEMAEQVQTAQTAEIAQMQTWLQTWYGITHEPEVDRKTRRQVEELSQLSGEEFETEFMAVLFEHHADALHHGTQALREAYHPDLINLAAMMIGAQADEMAQLRLWLQQWYQALDPDRQDRPVRNGRPNGNNGHGDNNRNDGNAGDDDEPEEDDDGEA